MHRRRGVRTLVEGKKCPKQGDRRKAANPLVPPRRAKASFSKLVQGDGAQEDQSLS